MEQGFNDDELADIMNEIESLEKEFTDDVDSMAAPVEEPVVQEEDVAEQETVVAEQETVVAEQDEIVAEEEVAEQQKMEPVVAEQQDIIDEEEPVQEVEHHVAQIDQEKIEQAHASAHDDHNVHHLGERKTELSDKPWQKSSMEFSVEGNMHLQLKFNVGGKTVWLNVNDENFDIELDHGMKFTLPLESKKSA